MKRIMYKLGYFKGIRHIDKLKKANIALINFAQGGAIQKSDIIQYAEACISENHFPQFYRGFIDGLNASEW